MIREINRPEWVFRGIRNNRKMYIERPIYGCDTETVNGEPYSIQIVGNDRQEFVFVNRKTVLSTFVDLLLKTPDKAIIYFHNLEFDLPVIFIQYHKHFTDSSFSLVGRNFRADILFGKVNHADIYIGKKYFELVDSFAYFKTSLASIAKKFGFENKLTKPRRLGEIKYAGKELKEFQAYAIRDSEIEFELGKKIQEYHEKYNVGNTISAPQMAARIFRTKYIPANQKIPSCPYEVDEASVLSYHGGKNGIYVPPGIYKNVRVYDINSAYPFAMTQIPNFLECSYEYVLKFTGKQEGVFCVSGLAIQTKYSTLFQHDFTPIVGRFERVWITSYELRTLIKHRILSEYQIHEGFVVIPNKAIRYNPLKAFAEEFFSLKSKSKGDIREFYKVILNSLYGKFIQSTNNDSDEHDWMDLNRPENKPFYQAGGLWNPLLATLITGFVRSFLTEKEIEFSSMHSSTDSIMTKENMPTSLKLGTWDLKVHGTLLVLRPKFYLIWDKGNRLKSFATHGYHGSLIQLIRLLRTGKRKYFHLHMTKVRESLRQNSKPLVMKKLWKQINIPIGGKICIPPNLLIECNRCKEWIKEMEWYKHRRRCNA